MPIKSESVIQDLILALELGTLMISNHAGLRMKERNIDFSDVEEAIFEARREEFKDELTLDGKAWKYAISGRGIRLVVLYLEKPKMLLVTIIDKD